MRRYLPELEAVDGQGACTSPGASTPPSGAELDYPEPIVDHDDAAAAFLARRT